MIAEVARDTTVDYTRGTTLGIFAAVAILVLLYALCSKVGRSLRNNRAATRGLRRIVEPPPSAQPVHVEHPRARARRSERLGRPRPQATERSRRRSATVVTPQYRRPDFTVVIDGVEFEGWHR